MGKDVWGCQVALSLLARCQRRHLADRTVEFLLLPVAIRAGFARTEEGWVLLDMNWSISENTYVEVPGRRLETQVEMRIRRNGTRVMSVISIPVEDMAEA